MKYALGAIFCLFLTNFALAQEKIDINTASLEDLIKITHIGEARARELISLRPFYSLDELTKIKGIGEKRLEDIKNQNLAWVNQKKWLEARPLTKTAEDKPPQTIIELTGDDNNYPLLAAIFTSLSGGVMILILKKYVRT